MEEVYSPNDSFKNLVGGERVFGLRGYIEHVHMQEVRQHPMLKFTLTNGDAKVVCTMFDQFVQHYLPNLLLNRIVEIDAGFVRPIYYKPVNRLPYDICIDKATTINFFGLRHIGD